MNEIQNIAGALSQVLTNILGVSDVNSFFEEYCVVLNE